MNGNICCNCPKSHLLEISTTLQRARVFNATGGRRFVGKHHELHICFYILQHCNDCVQSEVCGQDLLLQHEHRVRLHVQIIYSHNMAKYKEAESYSIDAALACSAPWQLCTLTMMPSSPCHNHSSAQPVQRYSVASFIPIADGAA